VVNLTTFHRLTIAELRRETADCVSLRFAVPPHLAETFRFRPGQHVTLRRRISGEELRRSYSICSALDDSELRVAIKRVAHGRFSRWANESLRAGDGIDVMPPTGSFAPPIEPERTKTWIAFAAGSGITPILSIVRSVLERETHSRVLLVFGNRDTDSIIFREALEDLKNRHITRFSLFHVLSREEQEIPLLSGRIDRAKLDAFFGALINATDIDHALLCGPVPMIETLREGMRAHGVPDDRIAIEFFDTPSTAPSAVAPEKPREGTTQVTIIRDGVRTQFVMNDSGDAIIDAADRAGLELPFSCKGGVCATCRCKLVEGGASMLVNYALAPWEIEQGYILACQARPTTATLVLDFDQS
jgi:ring-1,2-phenylacetyl-CoA epoxidase subunit PaaE